MERQPGMSRETTDRERSVLFVQVCICVCVCLQAPPALPASDFGTKMWFQLGLFLKSETHRNFKQSGDISVASSALFSFYYQVPLPDFSKTVSGDVSPHFHAKAQLSLTQTDGDVYECKMLHKHSHCK